MKRQERAVYEAIDTVRYFTPIFPKENRMIDRQDRLTSSNYWHETIKNRRNSRRRLAIHDEIAAYLPRTSGLSFVEIGCAPGTILSDFCSEFGYIANGIEYAEDPEEIRNLIEGDGVVVEHILSVDFLDWKPSRKYDIVSSFGFIEHFNDADHVVDLHFDACVEGGLVILVVPNFARGQYILRWLFDRDNLRRHNTRTMNVEFFRRSAERNGADVVQIDFAGGHFGFWREPDTPMGWLMTRLYWRIEKLIRYTSRFFPGKSNKYLSPYIYAIFRRPCSK